MTTTKSNNLIALLHQPIAPKGEQEFKRPGQLASARGLYVKTPEHGWHLQQRFDPRG